MEKHDEQYMKMTEIWASNSHAIRNKVGALVVKDNMIISDGYNGMPRGFDNCCEHKTCSIKHFDEKKCQYATLKGNEYVCDCPDTGTQCPYLELVTNPEVLHAEANAITKLARSTQSSDGATLYVTLSPCPECAKLIVQSGIKRVVYKTLYRKPDGIEFLKKCGITVEQVTV